MNPKVLNIKKVSMIIDTKPKSAQHYCCWVKNTNDLAETALSNTTGWREIRDSAFTVLLDTSCTKKNGNKKLPLLIVRK